MLEVITPAAGVNQFAIVAGVEADSHGIDSEIAAGKVVINGAGRHAGQCSGLSVGFRAGSCQVNAPFIPLEFSRIKTGVGGDFPPVELF